MNHWVTDHLTSRLSSLSSPDDLFNFFSEMRGELILFRAFFHVFSYFLVISSVLRDCNSNCCFKYMPSGILGGPEAGVVEDDQIILDPNSSLGMFLRHCVLAFNMLSFEV